MADAQSPSAQDKAQCPAVMGKASLSILMESRAPCTEEWEVQVNQQGDQRWGEQVAICCLLGRFGVTKGVPSKHKAPVKYHCVPLQLHCGRLKSCRGEEANVPLLASTKQAGGERAAL